MAFNDNNMEREYTIQINEALRRADRMGNVSDVNRLEEKINSHNEEENAKAHQGGGPDNFDVDFVISESADTFSAPRQESISDLDSSLIHDLNSGAREDFSPREVDRLIDLQARGLIPASSLANVLGAESQSGGGLPNPTPDTTPNLAPGGQDIDQEIREILAKPQLTDSDKKRIQELSKKKDEMELRSNLSVEINNLSGLSFQEVQNQLVKMQLKDDFTEKDPRFQALNIRLKDMEEEARLMGLDADYEERAKQIESELDKIELAKKQGKLKPGDVDRVRNNITKIANNRSGRTNQGKIASEPAHLKGIRAHLATVITDDLLGRLEEKANRFYVVEIMTQVKNTSEPSPQKRMANIEKLTGPEDQRRAVRVIIEELEASLDVSPRDGSNNQIRQALENLLRKPEMNPQVVEEAWARLHLHACAATLRTFTNTDADKIGPAIKEALSSRIGEYMLTGKDFEALLQKPLPGLKVSEAFSVLQEASRLGAFSGGKMGASDEQIKANLIDQIYTRFNGDPTFDRKGAEKSYELAMKIAEATFEKSVWDTSARDYMSQAIHFGEFRRAKKKGSSLTYSQIPTIATSFFRSVVNPEDPNKARLFNRRQWGNISNDVRDARFQVYMLQSNPDRRGLEGLAAQFYGEGTSEYHAAIAKAQSLPSEVDFSGIDFSTMSTSAYGDYLTSYIPDVLKAKMLLTQTDFKVGDLDDPDTLREWGEVLDKVDPTPNKVMNIRYWFAVGAIDLCLNQIMDNSEASRVIRHMVESRKTQKGDMAFLPKVLLSGVKTEHDLFERTQAEPRGLANSARKRWEKITRITR